MYEDVQKIAETHAYNWYHSKQLTQLILRQCITQNKYI